MKKSILSLALAVLMVMTLFTVGAFADGDTLTVGVGENYTTISDAVKAAKDGDTIYIKDGTYQETVTITGKALTLEGESRDGVIIKFDYSSRNTTAKYNGTECYPIVSSDSALTIKNLTIAGPTAQHHGIGGVYASADLTMDSVTVKDIRCTADGGEVCGVQYGKGIMVDGSGNVSITNCEISDFQKAAIDVNTSGTVFIDNNIIKGVGSQAIIAQNGIVARNGDVTISNNEISDLSYTAENEWKYGSTGIYPLGDVTSLTIKGNLIDNVDGAMYLGSVAEEVLAAAQIIDNTVINLPAPVTNETTGSIYATIKDAVDDANNGDTITVAPGTYNMDPDECIIIDKKLTIRGAGESTVISGSGTTDYGLGLFTFNAGSEGSVIEDLTINYTASGAQRSAVYFNYGFEGSADNVTKITNVHFKGADSLEEIDAERAIAIGSTYIDGGYIEISGCTIENFAYGMYFNAVHDLAITGNTINGTKYNGINIAGDGNIACEYINIAGNTLTNIAAANYNSDLYSSGISIGQNSSDIDIADNAISMLNGKPGIYFVPKADGTPAGYVVTILDGKTVIDQIAVSSDNNTIILPDAPKNSGYIFLGWRCDNVTYKAGETVTVNSDMTFTAVWGNLPDVDPEDPEEPEVPDFPFYDVNIRDWYYDAVYYVWDKGLMDGVDTHEFAPNATLTRAMVWTIIARAEGVDTTGGSSWYAKAQEWVVAKGISDGENPSAAITRQELVTMLYRLAGEPSVSGSITAPDAASVSSWASDAMVWAMNIGLIEGDENGAVTPTATATRAQAAAIFMRYIEA